MSNNKIANINGKKTIMVDLNSAKPVHKIIANTNSNTKQDPNKRSQSKSRKQIKDEVNLLEDSDSTNENDSSKQNGLGKLTRLSYRDTKYKKNQAKKKSDPAATYIPVEDIKEKLKFYKRVNSADIPKIHLGMRIKYIQIMDNGTYNFKPGGELIVNGAPDYIVLAGNRKTWSVQLATHIIFVEQLGLIRHNYEQKLKELTDQNNIMMDNTNKLNNKIQQLKAIIKLSDTNIIDNTDIDNKNNNVNINKKKRTIKMVNMSEQTKVTKSAKVSKAK